MPNKSADLVADLASRLERSILSGEYEVGERLPAERKLCQQIGVSRSVVREAIGRLTSAGLLESRHGSGTRVTRPSPRQVTTGYKRLIGTSVGSLADLAVVRLSLETAMAALAAENRTDTDLARLDETQLVLGNPRKSLATHARADVKFHAILAEATGNAVYPLVMAPIHDLLVESRRRTLGKYGADLAYEHHARILDAVRRRDPEAAAEAMRIHLAINSQHLQELS